MIGIGVHATTITTNDSSSNIVLDGITGQWLSHWQTAQYNLNLPRAGIYDANHRYDSGIVLHGSNNILRNSTLQLSAGNGVNLKDSGHRVDNNRIHDPVHTGNGMHFDNGTHDVSVDHNVIWGLKSAGDINRGGNGINFGGHINRPRAGSNLPYLRGTFSNNPIVPAKGYTLFNYYATASHVANTTVKDNLLDGARPSGQIYGHITGGDPNDSGN